MKTIQVAVFALVAFLANALGDGWTINPPEKFSSLSESRRLAGATVSAVGDVLPEALTGIGSAEAVRNHIAKGAGLGLMRIYAGYGFQSTSGSWIEVKSSKASSVGYDSYQDCLIDVAEGLEVVLPTLRGSTNLPPNGDIYAILKITYFSDVSGTTPHDIGLWMVNKIGPLSSVRVESTIPLFGLDSPYGQENVVIPLPQLQALYIAAQRDGEISTMSWTANTGVQLSSTWPRVPRENTTAGYLYLNGWVARGQYPVRIKILAENGEEQTYTEFGERLIQPTLRMGKDGLHIETARGSNLRIFSSTDNVNWSEMSPILRAERSVTIPIDFGNTEMQYFKAIAW